MANLNSVNRLKAFVLSEASGALSRENVVISQTGAEIPSGTVLTIAGDVGSVTTAATAGNTGNPTFSAITVSAPAIPGDYKLTFTAATKFDLEAPDGRKVGSGTTGVAFNKGGLAFTLTAGGTPAVAGDEFTLTAGAGNRKWAPYAAGGTAGPAAGILYNHLSAATGDVKAVAFARNCEVKGDELTGLDAAAIVDLEKRGVIVRTATSLSGTY